MGPEGGDIHTRSNSYLRIMDDVELVYPRL